MCVTEIAYFKSTAAFQTDHKLLDPLAANLKQMPGLLSIYFGFQVEDPTIAYIANVWESSEHHAAVGQRPDYTTLFAAVVPAAVDPKAITMLVIAPPAAQPDLTADASLSAPVTEYSEATLKTDATREELAGLLKTLAESRAAQATYSGPILLGKEGAFGGLIGWNSVEEHVAARQNPALAAAFKRAHELLDTTVVHVKFWKA